MDKAVVDISASRSPVSDERVVNQDSDLHAAVIDIEQNLGVRLR